MFSTPSDDHSNTKGKQRENTQEHGCWSISSLRTVSPAFQESIHIRVHHLAWQCAAGHDCLLLLGLYALQSPQLYCSNRARSPLGVLVPCGRRPSAPGIPTYAEALLQLPKTSIVQATSSHRKKWWLLQFSSHLVEQGRTRAHADVLNITTWSLNRTTWWPASADSIFGSKVFSRTRFFARTLMVLSWPIFPIFTTLTLSLCSWLPSVLRGVSMIQPVLCCQLVLSHCFFCSHSDRSDPRLEKLSRYYTGFIDFQYYY